MNLYSDRIISLFLFIKTFSILFFICLIALFALFTGWCYFSIIVRMLVVILLFLKSTKSYQLEVSFTHAKSVLPSDYTIKINYLIKILITVDISTIIISTWSYSSWKN